MQHSSSILKQTGVHRIIWKVQLARRLSLCLLWVGETSVWNDSYRYHAYLKSFRRLAQLAPIYVCYNSSSQSSTTEVVSAKWAWPIEPPWPHLWVIRQIGINWSLRRGVGENTFYRHCSYSSCDFCESLCKKLFHLTYPPNGNWLISGACVWEEL